MRKIDKRVHHHKTAKVVITLAVLLAAGVLWQYIMEERESRQYRKAGEFIDVGSYNMHYYCEGEGATAFLFITGSGTPCAYTDFYQLQQDLSSYGKTISFDHAGFGWSSETKEKREIRNLINELHILRSKVASKQKKVILISHSLGALESIHYAQEYPEEVSGIIFLDGGSPEFYSKDSEIKAVVMNRIFAGIRGSGIARLLALFGEVLPVYGENIRNKALPEKQQKLDLTMYEKYMGNVQNLDVILSMNENAEYVKKKGALSHIPILVLSSDSGSEWKKVQEQLASWSDKSRQVTIKGADHYLHWSNAGVVKEEILSFMENLGEIHR